jgi:MerR family mercuric resistance operon transcriptional regulator
MTEGLTIGKLARAARVNIETVRYYQRRGLLPKPPRPVGGIRRYPAQTLARLTFIKRAQQLGFTLREIGELLRLDGRDCRETRQLAESRRADIDARLRDLKAMRATLDRLIRTCRVGGAASCPIIDTLSRDNT